MQSVLITLTAPSCAGKSFLFSYIRDVAKLSCLISTTTRPIRNGESEGIDYHFISEEHSFEVEDRDGFAELCEYRGFRYGVTKEEFHSKLKGGLAFLIVEPSGIDHYVKPALDIGAKHFKVWIDVPMEVRLERMKERVSTDLSSSAKLHKDRLLAMQTVEAGWHDLVKWDLELSGEDTPQENLVKILSGIKNA